MEGTFKSGLPRYSPDSTERISAENNILFETRTSNTAKMEMEEESCNALRNEIKKRRLSHGELYSNKSGNAILEKPCCDACESAWTRETDPIYDYITLRWHELITRTHDEARVRLLSRFDK
jgi:hypothetical protein